MPKKSIDARRRKHRAEAAADALYQSRTTPTKATYTTAYRHWMAKRIAGFALVVIGVVMALTHIASHLGGLRFLPTSGMQDLLIGFPMAALLFLAGVVLASRPVR